MLREDGQLPSITLADTSWVAVMLPVDPSHLLVGAAPEGRLPLSKRINEATLKHTATRLQRLDIERFGFGRPAQVLSHGCEVAQTFHDARVGALEQATAHLQRRDVQRLGLCRAAQSLQYGREADEPGPQVKAVTPEQAAANLHCVEKNWLRLRGLAQAPPHSREVVERLW
jgi:hypothetical protein